MKRGRNSSLKEIIRSLQRKKVQIAVICDNPLQDLSSEGFVFENMLNVKCVGASFKRKPTTAIPALNIAISTIREAGGTIICGIPQAIGCGTWGKLDALKEFYPNRRVCQLASFKSIIS